ncbi:ribbon-helix-helix protein, CopG family [Aquisalimonas sp.]|uniref:type II toxin-antitoxin system BrnA family antitoxin n=1 Tax=Aquisalimonas sp. TaxID=1872621 RepID=UPI0025C56B24|nr:ribbon-helix-helix protein, CopG family [Aquisalimonas sp.]
MKAKEFDRKFDAGEDVSNDLDLSGARRPRQAQKRVNVDFPDWMLEQLDKEARRLGVTRQSIIKIWLSERLEQVASSKRLHPRR